MGKPTMVQFVADRRAEGKTDSEIIHLLLDAGWQMDVIQKTIHGEPIRHRNLDPILDIRKQPLKQWVLYALAIMIPSFFIFALLLISL